MPRSRAPVKGNAGGGGRACSGAGSGYPAAMDEKERRVVEARLRMRERFLDRMKATPSLSDPAPQGTGPPNRHGMPELPVGQYPTEKWPVLDLGRHPEVPLDRWQLRIDGAVEEPVTLGWKDFQALTQVDDVSD